MSSRFLTAIALLAAIVVARASPAAQNSEPAPASALLREIVPNPTGKNGYEDLLVAAELSSRSKALDKAIAPGGTLAAKRSALAQNECSRALQMLRTGLRKPIGPVRSQVTVDTRFPEHRHFIRLAGLLRMEQYVLFSEGRTRAAIDNLRDGMLLDRAAQVGARLGRATSQKLLPELIRSFALRVEQLPVSDLNYVSQVCRAWLQKPPLAAGMVEAERRSYAEALARVRAEPGLLIDWWPSEVTGAGEPEVGLVKLARERPAAFVAEIDQAEEILNLHFRQIQQQLALPPSERKVPPLSKERSTAERLAGSLCYQDNIMNAVDSMTADRALVQLLVCHAGVQQYRWEHDGLPASLDALRLGDLARDPFTGRPFQYVVRGGSYEITTHSGPVSFGPVPGQVGQDGRQLISLPTR